MNALNRLRAFDIDRRLHWWDTLKQSDAPYRFQRHVPSAKQMHDERGAGGDGRATLGPAADRDLADVKQTRKIALSERDRFQG